MIKVAVDKNAAGGNIVTLQEELVAVWRDKVLTVPAGFSCDGCSAPEFLWDSVSPAIDPRTLRAALVHDFIYRTHPAGWSRKEADELFYDFAREDGLSWLRAQKAYWGLRLFGGLNWEVS